MKLPDISFMPLGLFMLACGILSVTNGCPASNNANAQPQPQIKSANWETISVPNGVDFCDRARVPGGWIVHTTGSREAAMTFVPDPEHKWLAPEVESTSDLSAETLKRYVEADRATYEAMKLLFKDVQNDELTTIMHAWEHRLQLVEGR